MRPELFGELIIYMVVLIFAISAHEAAHAWMSYKFGDDTAYLLGRITLNPAKHVDPIGTLLIPVAGFLMANLGGSAFLPFLIGWGKPTPVNPLRWRNKDVANVMVSIAGILANLAIATSVFVVIKILRMTGAGSAIPSGLLEPLGILLQYGLLMNVSLAVFNLLPIPPLDGSKVLWTFLPDGLKPVFEMMERFSYIILIIAIQAGLFSAIIRPVYALIFRLL
jgi:Zn-dependent protease